MKFVLMSRNILTVRDLWREYTSGVCGQTSIRDHVKGGMKGWGQTEKKFYNRRNIILDEVSNRVKSGTCVSHDIAVKELDDLRLANGGKSLDWLGKHIR